MENLCIIINSGKLSFFAVVIDADTPLNLLQLKGN